MSLTAVDFALEKLQSGTVVFKVKDQDGNPVEGLTFNYNSEGNLWISLHTDQTQPGVYVAKDQLEGGTWEIGAFRRDLKSITRKVKVVTGQTVEVEIVMSPRPPK